MLTFFQQKASEIIKESIKSAIFIDEKARPFFSTKSTPETLEEKLSLSLYESFKNQGISLAVHKFSKGDETKLNLKKYLFDGRDLVLLDWKLADQTGEDMALKMLSDIVKKPHLHFCAIYTSVKNLNEIYNNILNYFSGQTEEFFISLKEEFDAYEEELRPILDALDIGNIKSNGRILGRFIRELGRPTLEEVKLKAETSDDLEALKFLKIAFSNLHKASEKLPVPELISVTNKTLVIQNTIITILEKKEKSDPTKLIDRLALQITASKNSFTQLLGFEMQSLFRNNSSFIDANLLNITKEALLSHRQYMLTQEKSDLPFKSLIKNVLVEHAAMSLRTADLSLLEKSFLDGEMEELKSTNPSDEVLATLNLFYNSVKTNKIHSSSSQPILNFGDVFVDGDKNYYICLTALCDCLRPSKIKNNYFFAKGNLMNLDLALQLGDSAFISFLPNNKVVSWVAPEQGIKRDTPTTIDDYKGEVEYFKQYKYKPIYIKPISYFVPSNEIIDNQIELSRNESDKGSITIKTEYLTTIRPNYTQRLANHAFSHPVRVGVEFVVKSK